jgi:hypothetical protein
MSTRDPLLHPGLTVFSFFRRHKLPNFSPEHLFWLESQELALGSIDAEYHAVSVNLMAGNRSLFEKTFEPRLGFSKSSFEQVRRFARQGSGCGVASPASGIPGDSHQRESS